MLPLAHVATAILLGRAARAPTGFAVLGSLAPDLVDKPPAWVMKLTPSGRYLGHSLPSCLVLSMAAAAVFGRRAGVGFGLGYLSHLVGDAEGAVPWLMPLVPYDLPQDRRFPVKLSRSLLLREALGLTLIVLFVRGRGRNRAPTPS